MTNRRPKYLQYADDAQDAIEAAPDGLTILEIAKITKSTYASTQRAVAYLRSTGRIGFEYRGQFLHLTRLA